MKLSISFAGLAILGVASSRPENSLRSKSKKTSTSSMDDRLDPIPTNPDDNDEPAWEAILEIAFPTWQTPADGCPSQESLAG